MTFTSWLIVLVVTVLFGTKVISCIRHYVMLEKETKAKIKIIDLFSAILLGSIPFVQILAAIVAMIGFVVAVVFECVVFKNHFFNRNLFGGDDD
jgi:predicted lysophospholipase L1 biosynthesis ABC-type transport system permease subunit